MSVDVAGEAGDGYEALERISSIRPDVVLSETRLPSMNGIEVAAWTRRECPGVRMLMLSGDAGDETVCGAFDAGACGYLTKTCTAEELEEAIRGVHEGGTWIGRDVAHCVVSPRNHDRQPDGSDRLTLRERQVLQLVAEGYTGPQIAGKLGISAKTVDTDRFRFKQKLGLHHANEIFQYAVRHGLIGRPQGAGRGA